MFGRRAAALSIVVLLAAQATPAAATVAPTAVDKLYAHAQRTLKAIGVYHLVTVDRSTGGGLTTTTRTEQWVDAAKGVSRTTTSSGAGPSSHELIAGGIEWEDGVPSSPVTCHSVEAAVASVLGRCPTVTSERVTTAKYRASSALVLIIHSTVDGEDETVKLTTLITIDPRTALPLAGSYTGTREAATITHFRGTLTFTSERLKAAGLPRNFFTPAALGWHLTDPTKRLPHGRPIYWLGKQWTPGGALPSLVLQLAAAAAGHPELLSYGLASDPYGPTVLVLRLWKASTWAAAKDSDDAPLCQPQSQLTLTNGVATFHCPASDNSIIADIDLPGAHVEVQPAGYSNVGDGFATSPLTDLDALSTVIEALRVRT